MKSEVFEEIPRCPKWPRGLCELPTVHGRSGRSLCGIHTVRAITAAVCVGFIQPTVCSAAVCVGFTQPVALQLWSVCSSHSSWPLAVACVVAVGFDLPPHNNNKKLYIFFKIKSLHLNMAKIQGISRFIPKSKFSNIINIYLYIYV